MIDVRNTHVKLPLFGIIEKILGQWGRDVKMKDDPNAICNYKMPELSSNAKNDIHFMTDLEYLSDIGRDSKKYNL